jgi:hypothetical protein
VVVHRRDRSSHERTLSSSAIAQAPGARKRWTARAPRRRRRRRQASRASRSLRARLASLALGEARLETLAGAAIEPGHIEQGARTCGVARLAEERLVVAGVGVGVEPRADERGERDARRMQRIVRPLGEQRAGARVARGDDRIARSRQAGDRGRAAATP